MRAARHPSGMGIEDLRDVCLESAECLYDPELHDGPRDRIETARERAAREDVARQVCAMCPGRDACLEYALRVRPRRGMWAGFTASDLTGLGTVIAGPKRLKDVA